MSLFSFTPTGGSNMPRTTSTEENTTSDCQTSLNHPPPKMTFTDMLNTKIQNSNKHSSEDKNSNCSTVDEVLDCCDYGYGCVHGNALVEEGAEEMRRRYFLEMQRNLLDDVDTDNEEQIDSKIVSTCRSTTSVSARDSSEVLGPIPLPHDGGDVLSFNPFASSVTYSPLSDENGCVENLSPNPSSRTPLSSSTSGAQLPNGSFSSISPSLSTHPTGRLATRKNVYVSELPTHWNTEKLRSVCATFGNIVSAKVMHDSNTNESRGYGFVMFETDEQAALCVRTLNSCKVDGRMLSCRFAHEKAMPSFAHSDRIPWQEFGRSPNSTTPSLSKDKLTDVKTQPDQQQGGNSLPNMELLKGAHVACFGDRSRPMVQRSHNIFIQGLPLQWNTDKLRSLCGTFGKVELAKVVRDATTSLSCGHGFVLFEREEAAALCVERLNGATVEGRTLTCRFARDKRGPGVATGAAPSPPVRPSGNDFLKNTAPLLVRMVDAQESPSMLLQSAVGSNKWSTVTVPQNCHTAVYSQSPLLVAGGVSPLLGLSPVVSPMVPSGVMTEMTEPPHGMQSFGCNIAGLQCLIAVPYHQTRIVSGFSNGDGGTFAALT
ncbi:RNA-binding protein, putative [Trypanosoma brucei brucei TREU927]|uniref:RNA-binding protein, putative n=1 Tax=Trypanosoma brucei brucei (strain 927/4 GUTat10.1) TaxID=185431 RepID=Q582F3_TRYB2|nr:RNA-binding protein, putative [Trypanosoma brucei brucei TREU927]AAX78878.1 RNA-binding protein, putative [Trypanosoma brucei]AAZ12602.1 RNA-binding protein, putative [Trypanosoma brucei brucei TREU927]